MDIKYIHSFEVNTESEFDKIQFDLANKISFENIIDEKDIKLIAGVDLAYWNENSLDKAVCSVIIINYQTKEIVEKISKIDIIKCPYIAGYLAFRELPLILSTVKELKSNPDIFMFDGNGYLHPKHMGIATHASFFLQKPTIGVAKKYFKIHNIDFTQSQFENYTNGVCEKFQIDTTTYTQQILKKFVEYNVPENIKGSYTDICINNEVYGRALRTMVDVKPIFISVGNFINIESTTKIVMSLINKESHIPIPTRLADLETHVVRKNNTIQN